MSFEYRDRVNRGKPRLSERFRGKSGEEIVEELRKDFAKRKQMFFDTAPRTQDFMKPGFPFDDTCSRWRNRGDSDLKHRLDEIAQRYPQFATQLRDWTTEEELPGGMGWGSKTAQSQPSAPQQTASQTQTEAATTTTQQPQQPAQTTQIGPEGDGRTQRATSAPPENRAKDQPQRFVSRLEINPSSAPGDTQQQQPQPPSQQAGQQQPPQQPQQSQSQQPAQPEPQKKPSNVRHIPIFVEGRNEPVMPRADIDSSTADFGSTFGSPPRERDSRDRDDAFHGHAKYAQYEPPTFGFMSEPKWRPQRRYRNTSPFMTRDPMHGSPPQQQHFPHQQQHPHYQQPHHSQQSQPQQSQPQQSQPQPQPQQHHQPQQQRQQPQQQSQSEPPRQPPQPKDPLQEVAAVQKDVDELMKQVEAFTGKRQDKQYIYLDEMLTRNLLKLDLVETEGKENVRAARKETIKCIQKAISILESKTMTPEEIAARDKAMEVDPEPTDVHSMEVSSVGDGAQETQKPKPADSSEPQPSATPAPEVASEPMSTQSPAPAEAPAHMDTSSAPEAEATSTKTTDSNTSSSVNTKTPTQPASVETVLAQPASAQTAPAEPSPAQHAPGTETVVITTASSPVDTPAEAVPPAAAS